MRKRILLAMVLLVFLLQTTVIPEIRIGGVHPNLVIMTLVVTLLIFDGKEGFIVAILSGLLQDVFLSKAIGINTLIYLLIALVLYRFKEVFFSENRMSVMIATALAGIFYHLAYYFVSVLILDSTRTFLYAVSTGVIESLVNLVMVYFFYGMLFRSLKGYPLN